MSKEEIQITKLNVFEVDPKKKYLLIMPIENFDKDNTNKQGVNYLENIFRKFFGESQILVLFVKNSKDIKLIEKK